MGRIEQEWEKFRATLWDKGYSDQQIEVLKKAFYLGAIGLMGIVIATSSVGLMAVMQEASKELGDYIKAESSN